MLSFCLGEIYEKNQNGAERLLLFLYIRNCAGAIARKEKRWKQSFQPASVRRLH